jgi:hypothetical protein
MAVKVVKLNDATHANIRFLPVGEADAGYMTGSPDVKWTEDDWHSSPSAVRIDQSPLITAVDLTADFMDMEAGAVTVAELAEVVRDAQAAFHENRRAGQRWPGVYFSRSRLAEVMAALHAGGVKSCPLGIADWNYDLEQATAEVSSSSGLFPVVWRQYANRRFYDAGVCSLAWLNRVSGPHVPVRHVASGEYSLAQIAVSRNTTVGHLLEVSAGAYTAADFEALGKAVLPAGVAFYTTNP